MAYSVAVDIGGTFTDLVAHDDINHRVLYTKTPTTYQDFSVGILECFRKARLNPAEAKAVNHGTTLVINSLIQRRGAKTALVTTRGFRDILEIARGNRPDPFDLNYRRDDPLIPRPLRFEVAERIGGKGDILTPLDLDELEKLAAKLEALAIESVAVFFLNSYVNPAHEEKAAAYLKRLMPNVYVTYSAQLTREWYEYERASTVAANGFVGRDVSTYIRKIEKDLKKESFPGTLFMMGSNGGLLSVERACQQPIALVESGPIGGCIGASAYADSLGLKNVIAFDMGGTTAKCALVENGVFSVGSTYYVNGYVKGFPIRSSVIDIVEVGAGGGSIAWLDEQKRLHVGPRSAGSTPGPVCYGRGGTEPTVTDANLLLGRIDAQSFLGGELNLDRAAASEVLRTRIAEPLGFMGEHGITEMAEGVLEIAAATMSGAIRQISIEHGLDPRDFVLFCYGGGGPLHSASLAHELAIPKIIIPPEPGNFSAVGMLLADARLDLSKTFVATLSEQSLATCFGIFAALEREAQETIRKEFGSGDIYSHHHAEMRYKGQQHSIKVLLSGLKTAAAVRAAFDRDYQKRYGHADGKAEVELQSLHLSTFARLKRPDLKVLPRPKVAANDPMYRPVSFGSAGLVQTPVYDRYSLGAGFSAEGPAIVEEYGSTTVVWPGDRFTVGTFGELQIDCSGAVS